MADVALHAGSNGVDVGDKLMAEAHRVVVAGAALFRGAGRLRRLREGDNER